MSSFGESKALSLVKEEPEEYIKHNLFQLSRIYPAGSRTDSTNYDPEPVWNVGCQVGKYLFYFGGMSVFYFTEFTQN